MIVVDTNIIAYLYLPTDYTKSAEQLLVKEPDWAAPLLWRSELRNVLAFYLRKNLLSFDQAYAIQTEAESLLTLHEYEVNSYEVLRLVQKSNCSAYDCEFIAIALHLDTKLVTTDKKILQAFPAITVSLAEAGG